MANHKSALKRARQNEVRRMRNRSIKTRVRNVVKDIYQSVADGQGDSTDQQLNQAKSIIDKAAKKGVIHPRNAARKISRLSKRINTLP